MVAAAEMLVSNGVAEEEGELLAMPILSVCTPQIDLHVSENFNHSICYAFHVFL